MYSIEQVLDLYQSGMFSYEDAQRYLRDQLKLDYIDIELLLS